MPDLLGHARNGGADAVRGSWCWSDRSAGAGYFSPRRRVCRLRFAAAVPIACGVAKQAISGPPRWAGEPAVGHEGGVHQAAQFVSKEAPRSQGRSFRSPAEAPRSNRSTAGASAVLLSPLPRGGPALPANPPPLYRGHPRTHSTGGDRTHHPSRLVSAMQEARGAGGSRCPARCDAGPSRAGVVGLVALRAGPHDVANRRGVRSSLADAADFGGVFADGAAAGRVAARLVRADSRGGAEVGGPARRRDRLAGERKNALAGVPLDQRLGLFPP